MEAGMDPQECILPETLWSKSLDAKFHFVIRLISSEEEYDYSVVNGSVADSYTLILTIDHGNPTRHRQYVPQ